MCSTLLPERDLKATVAASFKLGLGHKIKILMGEPFLLMGMSPKISRASWESESGESSMTGISTLNLGCFSFLTLPISLGLLMGFSKVVERDVLACSIASSFEMGGFGEESEEWMDVDDVALRGTMGLGGMHDIW